MKESTEKKGEKGGTYWDHSEGLGMKTLPMLGQGDEARRTGVSRKKDNKFSE